MIPEYFHKLENREQFEKYYVYDIESYCNVFTVSIFRISDLSLWRFEITERVNQGVELYAFLMQIRSCDGEMVGFNNAGYDYTVIHSLLERGGRVSAYELWQSGNHYISTNAWAIPNWKRHVKQVDLFKIHHFDNKARRTGLKDIEVILRSHTVQDLPYKPNTDLTLDQVDQLIPYNDKDVFETAELFVKSFDKVAFRAELSRDYGKDFTNFSDVRIGTEFFVMKLEEAGFQCYQKINGERVPVQTNRDVIHLNDAILPWITFQSPELQGMVNWLRAQSITETNGVFKKLSATVNGFTFDFGTGGIHGSIASETVCSDLTHVIIDLDVASFYPNLAISNNFYPDHFGPAFCQIYKDLYDMRVQAKRNKQSALADMLKLALNGVYGGSNAEFSPFRDPLYTMKITLNGQLLLCLLAEYLMQIDGLRMIQANTDGITVKLPRTNVEQLKYMATVWEQVTGLELESVEYNRMFIRDVNNYIAEKVGGGLKRKGTYCHSSDIGWHQDPSFQVVQKAVEAHVVRGVDIEDFIRNHDDKFDFCGKVKVPRNFKLTIGGDEYQRITRYYVGLTGGEMVKFMPHTDKQLEKAEFDRYRIYEKKGLKESIVNATTLKKEAELIQRKFTLIGYGDGPLPDRSSRIEAGWKVVACNNMDDFDWSNINYDYYIKEANKLVEPLLTKPV